MNLESLAIAKMRERMSKASLPELLAIEKEIKEKCKGGNDQVVFEESLIRDLYAYTVLTFLNLFGFRVFGGFVSAHISGKPWNDLDLMAPPPILDYSFYIYKCVDYLKIALGLMPMQIALHENSQKLKKHYAKSFRLNITKNDVTHTIKMDLVGMKSQMLKGGFIPVTIGKCLSMKKNIISLRNIPAAEYALMSWNVDEVVNMLQHGKDVGLSFADPVDTNPNPYKEYWWQRVDEVKKLGYTVDKFLGSVPSKPSKVSESS